MFFGKGYGIISGTVSFQVWPRPHIVTNVFHEKPDVAKVDFT